MIISRMVGKYRMIFVEIVWLNMYSQTLKIQSVIWNQNVVQDQNAISLNTKTHVQTTYI